MSYRIIFESFKIDKLESTLATRVLFIVLIMVRMLMTMAPIGDRNFQFLDYYLNRKFLDQIDLVLPTWGNIQVLLVYLLGMFLALCIGLLYADTFILENEKRRRPKQRLDPGDIFMIPISRNIAIPGDREEVVRTFLNKEIEPSSFKRNVPSSKAGYFRTALKDLLTKLPAFVCFLIFMSIVFSFSLTFFMIPFIVLAMVLLFTPLNMLYAGNGLVRSMELSHAQTNGLKFTLFMNFLLQNFIFTMLNNILVLALSDYHYSYLVIESFVFALQVLVMARQYGIFYQIVALKQPYETRVV